MNEECLSKGCYPISALSKNLRLHNKMGLKRNSASLTQQVTLHAYKSSIVAQLSVVVSIMHLGRPPNSTL